MANSSFNTEILSTTIQKWLPTLQDNIYESNVVFKWLKENGRVESVPTYKTTQGKDGGRSFVIPIEYAKSGNAQSYSGWQALNEVPTNVYTAAEFNIRQYTNWIGINGLEDWQNSGDEAMVDLLEARMNSAKAELADLINIDIYKAQTGTSLDGFGAAAASGLIASDGLGTIGGINASTDTYWKNKFGTSSSFAANGYSTMKTLYNDCTVGTDGPNFIVTDQTNFERYETIPEAREAFVKVNEDGKSINVGYPALSFKTIPVFFDRGMTSASVTNKMFFLNSKHLWLWQCKGRELTATPFVSAIVNGQDGMVSRIFWYGNLVTNERRKLGVMNITAA